MEASLDARRESRPAMPICVVVDACVLLRNVAYTLRKQREGALLASASHAYTLTSGVALFVTPSALAEVERNLGRIAFHVGSSRAAAWKIWNELFLPRLRVVELEGVFANESRSEAVRSLHANDAPIAALAVSLAPCLLLTDNRKHFAPLGLPDRPVDEIAIDIHKVSELMTGMNGAVLMTALTGTALAEGSKKIARTLGKEGTLLVALLLIGAAFIYLRSEPGGRFRRGVKAAARELGPPLLEAIVERTELSEQIAALAIEPSNQEPDAFREVAHRLSATTSMTTSEIAGLLKENGFVFDEGRHTTQVRAWLSCTPAFFELRRGHWCLGYEALPALNAAA